MMQMGEEYWAKHVAANQRESIPATEYARRHGLSVKSLYYWRRKLKKSDKADAPLPAGKFVALHIAPGGSRPSNCTLALSSGLRLEMHTLPQPEWLAALVRAMPEIR
jgi:transposase-like protein